MTNVDVETRGSSPPAGTVHVQNRLPAYVDHALGEAEMDDVEAHLLSCETCFAAMVVISLSRG